MWGTNKKYFGFRACKDLLQLFIIWAHFKDAKDTQNEIPCSGWWFWRLQSKKTRDSRRKKEVLINAYRLHSNRNEVINAFEDGVFPRKDTFQENKLDVPKLPNWERVDEKPLIKYKDEVKRVKDKNIYVGKALILELIIHTI